MIPTLLLYALVATAAAAGATVSFFAFSSWKASRSTPMFILGVGLTLLLLGSTVAAFGETSPEPHPAWVGLAHLSLVAAGFLLVLYSLYTRAPHRSLRRSPESGSGTATGVALLGSAGSPAAGLPAAPSSDKPT